MIIGGYSNSSFGLGYSKLDREGSDLPKAAAVAHVKSNLTNTEYDVVYALPASSDFLLVNVRNVSSSNQTTVAYSYKLGSTANNNDIIRIGDISENVFSN